MLPVTYKLTKFLNTDKILTEILKGNFKTDKIFTKPGDDFQVLYICVCTRKNGVETKHFFKEFV